MAVKREMMVRRGDLSATAINEVVAAQPGAGEVLLEIEAFALTTNNVTYAVVGEQVGYWHFFPAAEGWGIVPAWGYARVIASQHPEIAVGERLYGYVPMATHLTVRPGKVSPGLFRDMAAHRQPMSPVYNQYRRLAADPAHELAREAMRMLFEPLFLTSYLIADQFRREGFYGASNAILTSASSKTALGTAHVLRAASPDIRRIGLTGRDNVAFVEKTGLYDVVLAYDALDALPAGQAVLIDFAGNAALLGDIYDRLPGTLAYAMRVGATHHEERGTDGGAGGGLLPGPKPVWFFAPDAATALIGEIGQDGFNAAVAARWADFVVEAESWVTVEEVRGTDGVQQAWRDQVAARARPDTGTIIRW